MYFRPRELILDPCLTSIVKCVMWKSLVINLSLDR